MPNPTIKIHQLRVRLHTSRALAESLQQAVSQAVNMRLADEFTAGLSIVVQSSGYIAKLTLDLGELSHEGFERNFVQRLVRQLSEVIAALPAPEEAVQNIDGESVAVAHARSMQPSVSAVMSAATAASPLSALPACLLRFLQSGYWSYSGGRSVVDARELQADLGVNELDDGPEVVIAPGEEKTKRRAPVPVGSPARALEQLLSVQPAPADELLNLLATELWHNVACRRLWQNLGGQARRRLFDLFTRERWPVCVPQAADISPAGLMLAAWHYALQPSSILVLHGGQYENHQVLAALTPVETDWLDALLIASARRPALLAAVLPPLRRYASVWGARLSVPAQQQLWQWVGGRQTGEDVWKTVEGGAGCSDGQQQPAAKSRESSTFTVPDTDKIISPARGGSGEPQDSLPPQLHVSNAGIVLLWPLLPRLFTQLNLLEKPQQDAPYRFISQQTLQRAVGILDALVWADNEPAEWRCVVNKWLCNWPLSAPLEACLLESDEDTCAFLTGWLSSLSLQLPGLQRCEPDELRALFLQRPGMMLKGRDGWHLTVEPHASDIMLAKLPWPLQQPTLPWLTEPLTVKWQLSQYPIF